MRSFVACLCVVFNGKTCLLRLLELVRQVLRRGREEVEERIVGEIEERAGVEVGKAVDLERKVRLLRAGAERRAPVRREEAVERSRRVGNVSSKSGNVGLIVIIVVVLLTNKRLLGCKKEEMKPK